jgi:hypothetical protein
MPNVTIDDVARLSVIFAQKKWKIDENLPGKDTTVFERFIKLMEKFNPEERDLLFFQIERFVRIEFVEYVESLNRIADELCKSDNFDKIIVIPMKNRKDFAKQATKSGDLISYLLQTMLTARGKIVYTFTDISAKLIRSKLAGDVSLIIGVDDFIGSGKTAIEFIENVEDLYKIYKPSIYVASICALDVGYNRIKEKTENVFVDVRVNRGISDVAEWDEKTKIQQKIVMTGIESNIRIGDEYKFGFMKSEALVKMIRTPNNTFPIYWCSTDQSGASWPSPFPR